MKFSPALDVILNHLLPRVCPLCEQGLSGAHELRAGLCPACHEVLPGRRLTRCWRCALHHPECGPDDGEQGRQDGRPLGISQGISQGRPRDRPPEGPPVGRPCPLEQSQRLPWDGALAWVDYDYPVDGWIHALKFQGEASLATSLGFGLAQTVLNAPDEIRRKILSLDAIVPLPLSRERLARRGFNQTQLIARAFTRALPDAPLDTRSLTRVRHGPALSLMPSEGRQALVRGAYAADNRVRGKRLGLLDDVMTTGASLAEATRTLREAGAAEVIILVAARTPLESAC